MSGVRSFPFTSSAGELSDRANQMVYTSPAGTAAGSWVFVIVTDALPLTPANIAVTVALPTFSAVATPAESIDSTLHD